MKRNIFSILLSILLSVTLMLCVYGEESSDGSELVVDGTCGDMANWSFCAETGTLTISGNGPMNDYSSSNTSPWSHLGDNIRSLIVEEGITTVGAYAFSQNYRHLSGIQLPHSLRKIGLWAFQGCSALEEIVIPYGVEEIDGNAFRNCEKLRAVEFPESLLSMGNLFRECPSLKQLKVPGSVKNINDSTFSDNTGLEEVILSEGIETLGILVFTNCSSLKAVTLPNSLLSIGGSAFDDCSSLKEIYIPQNVVANNFGGDFFENCKSLEKIEVHPDNTSFASLDGVLYAKDMKTLYLLPQAKGGHYEMPATVETVADYAVGPNSVLESISFPNSYSFLGKDFYHCSNIKAYQFPEDHPFNTVKDGAIYSKDERVLLMYLKQGSDTEISVPSHVAEIGSYAFYGCHYTKISLPAGLQTIGSYAFSCADIENMYIPNTVRTLESYAFAGCASLKEVHFPVDMKNFGDHAFYQCTKLETLHLPLNLESIPWCAFAYCTGLKHVVLPESVSYLDANAFWNARVDMFHFLGDAPTYSISPSTQTSTTFLGLRGNLILHYAENSEGYSTNYSVLKASPCSHTYEITATCLQSGILRITFSCGYTVEREIGVLPHSFGPWEVTVAADQQSPGQMCRSCTGCQETETKVIPVLPRITVPEQCPAISDNEDRQSYSAGSHDFTEEGEMIINKYYSGAVSSHLLSNPDGTLTRVEYIKGSITVETYDGQFRFLSRCSLPMELPIYGGFYSGEHYNYLVLGQKNPTSSDDVEVIRVIRYSKNWERMDSASVYTGQTYLPFDAGATRMLEVDDMLYIHCTHIRYSGHQANLVIGIRTTDMVVTDYMAHLKTHEYGYVSHSFNEFILEDENRLLTLNHGDGYPRGLVITRWGRQAGDEIFSNLGKIAGSYTYPMEFVGYSGDNETGASVGGFEVSDHYYLIAGSSRPQDSYASASLQQYNIFVTLTPRDFNSYYTSDILWITNYEEGSHIDVSTPHLLKLSSDRFLLMWTESKVLCYTFINGSGQLQSEVYRTTMPLSDCKPILYGNAVCWYVTENSEPAFFLIPLEDPSHPQLYNGEVSITLRSEGSNTALPQIIRTYGEAYGELPIPTRNKPAYTFDDWFYDSSWEQPVDPTDLVTRLDDHTIVAHWIKVEHQCDYVLKEVIPATCTAGETKVYECTLCDSVKTKESSPLEHTYVDGFCIGCGVEMPPIVPPTLVEDISIHHSLNLASDIAMNYMVPGDQLANYDSFYMECILPVYTGNDLTASKTVIIEGVEKDGYYYFVLEGLTAVQMNDIVQATLFLSKDSENFVSHTDTYSVATYAYNRLNTPGVPEALQTLCGDLLRYGSAAQIFKSYRTDNLADSLMTEEQKAFLSDIETVSFGNHNEVLNDLDSPSVTWAGKAMDLASKVTLKFIFTPGSYTGDPTALTLRLTFSGMDGTQKTEILTGAVLYNEEQGLYAFSFDGLLAAELRSVLSVRVYEGDHPVSCTLQYSADTYGHNKPGTLGELCKALFAYSDSAKAYFLR